MGTSTRWWWPGGPGARLSVLYARLSSFIRPQPKEFGAPVVFEQLLSVHSCLVSRGTSRNRAKIYGQPEAVAAPITHGQAADCKIADVF